MRASDYIHNKLLGFFVKTNGIISKQLFGGLGHILCFHRVMPLNNSPRIYANSGMEISPEKLEWIISFFLKKHYEVLSMDQLLDLYRGKRKQKLKFIVITFDDGYLDNYQIAYPLLKKMGLPFTIYVTTGFPDNKTLLWWYFLEKYILENEQISWTEKDEIKNYQASTLEEKNKLFLYLRKIFINTDPSTLRKSIKENFKISENEIENFTKNTSMSWSQITELSSDPLVCIGAHSLSHDPFNKLSEENVIFEMAESKKIIESYTRKPVLHFAYPYGSSDEAGEREYNLLELAGYKTGVTLRQGNCFLKHARNIMRLPRIPLGEKTDALLLNHICNGIRQYSFNGFKKVI